MWWLVCNCYEFVLSFSTLVKVIEYTHKTQEVQQHNVLSLKIVWIFIAMKLVSTQFVVCASILNMYCYERGDQANLTYAFFCVHLFMKLTHSILSKMQFFSIFFLISKFHKIFISWMHLIKDVIFFNFFLD
jgi:hypothetical protein